MKFDTWQISNILLKQCPNSSVDLTVSQAVLSRKATINISVFGTLNISRGYKYSTNLFYILLLMSFLQTFVSASFVNPSHKYSVYK